MALLEFSKTAKDEDNEKDTDRANKVFLNINNLTQKFARFNTVLLLIEWLRLKTCKYENDERNSDWVC